MAARSIVTASWVVTASSKGAESSPGAPRPAPAGGQLAGDPEDPIRIGRAAQPGAEVHQHGVGEARGLLASYGIGHPSRIPPEHVEVEPVGRLPIRQALEPLQVHDHGQDRGGTERRPVGSKRSANSSRGNSLVRSRARNRYTDPSGTARLAPASTGGGQDTGSDGRFMG